jgi:histidine triad (HIT) family protein
MKITHAPKEYVCPFCLLVKGIENRQVYSRQKDIVYQDTDVTVFVASHWWPNNKGHVLIIPNEHIENIYSLNVELSNRIHELEIELAKAIKVVYKCDGVSSRQHNEPCNQDVWHYHLHIYPRYFDDNLYGTERIISDEVERAEFAQRLRYYFSTKQIKIGN